MDASAIVFIRDYAYTLVNAWFFWAGGALTVNELSGLFLGKSWDWPRKHRLKSAAILLIVAQIGAYKSLQDESRTDLKDAAERAVKAETSGAVLDAENKKLNERISEMESLLRRKPQEVVIKQAPIDVRVKQGPLGSHRLTDGPLNIGWTPKDWQTITSRPVQIQWDDMDGVDAVAEVTVLSWGEGKWAQVRIWDETAKAIAVEGPRTTVGVPKGGQFQRLKLPKASGMHFYVLQILSEHETTASAVGDIVFVRR